MEKVLKNIRWIVYDKLQEYSGISELMEKKTLQILNKEDKENIWILEHENVYTKGYSTDSNDLLSNQFKIPVVNVSRGGKFTYHGPGQIIIYPLLNLGSRGKDLKLYISKLEQWMILILSKFNIQAYSKHGLIGVWVNHHNTEKKIAAIGVRVSRWITSHGIALNVNTNLDYFKGIVPCGIPKCPYTSLSELIPNAPCKKTIISELISTFYELF